MGHGLFLFIFFSNTNLTEKAVGFCGIQTQIVGVAVEHTDHLTTSEPYSYFEITISFWF